MTTDVIEIVYQGKKKELGKIRHINHNFLLIKDQLLILKENYLKMVSI